MNWTELKERARMLQEVERWTSEEEEEYYAERRRILEEAGWSVCYHRDGARVHFGVKVSGFWSGMWGARIETEQERGDTFDSNRVEEEAFGRHEFNREIWWQEDLPDFIRYDLGYRHSKVDAWSCGRSGGYVNVPGLESELEDMVRLGEWLESEVSWFDSANYGRELWFEALKEYDAERILELASPRAERVEA